MQNAETMRGKTVALQYSCWVICAFYNHNSHDSLILLELNQGINAAMKTQFSNNIIIIIINVLLGWYTDFIYSRPVTHTHNLSREYISRCVMWPKVYKILWWGTLRFTWQHIMFHMSNPHFLFPLAVREVWKTSEGMHTRTNTLTYRKTTHLALKHFCFVNEGIQLQCRTLMIWWRHKLHKSTPPLQTQTHTPILPPPTYIY